MFGNFDKEFKWLFNLAWGLLPIWVKSDCDFDLVAGVKVSVGRVSLAGLSFGSDVMFDWATLISRLSLIL